MSEGDREFVKSNIASAGNKVDIGGSGSSSKIKIFKAAGKVFLSPLLFITSHKIRKIYTLRIEKQKFEKDF